MGVIINKSPAIPHGTYLYSFGGTKFVPPASTDSVAYNNNRIEVGQDNLSLFCPIELPNGATVTHVLVNGNAGAVSGETWQLLRLARDIPIASIEMATASFDSEDSSITEPVIDNNQFVYVIRSSSLDTGDAIHGGRITYTL